MDVMAIQSQENEYGKGRKGLYIWAIRIKDLTNVLEIQHLRRRKFV
jgi:hypothetical protein